MMNDEYYRILGVTIDDEEDYINQRYRELSQVWHPDKCGRYNICTDERRLLFTEQQQKINEAHRKLKAFARQRVNNSKRLLKKDRFVEFRGEEVAVHDIYKCLIAILSLCTVFRVLLLKSREFSTSEKIGTIAAVVLSSVSVFTFQESEHIDLVMLIISPMFLYISYKAVSDLCRTVGSFLMKTRSYVMSAILMSLSCYLLRIGLPRMAAVLIWLCIILNWKVLDARIILLCTGACFLYLRSPSGSNMAPMQEFSNEIVLLRIYLSVFVVADVFEDSTIRQLAHTFYSCLEKRNCSDLYISKLAQSILDQSYSSCYSRLASGLQYIPHMLVLVSVWVVGSQVVQGMERECISLWQQLLHSFSRPSSSRVSLGKDSRNSVSTDDALGADHTDNHHTEADDAAEGEVLEQQISLISSCIPGISPAEAAAQLKEHKGNVDETIGYLQSAAGRAGLAASRRKPRSSPHQSSSSSSSSSSMTIRKRKVLPPPSVTL